MKTIVSSDFNILAVLFLLTLTICLLAPATLQAKDDADRTRFYGLVEAMPEGMHGTWIIGGQEVTTHPRTEFDQTQGPLQIGACAKVDIRGGMVHEIDSEPPSDCR